MFRRVASTLPKDPSYPANLKDLGYFINDNQQIKSIEHPTDDFRFWITTHGRWNDVHREAMHTCIRDEVLFRLAKLDIHPLYLPTLTTARPPTSTPHVPILTSPTAELRKKERVIVIVNRVFEDLAIWAYRVLSKEGGIDIGSAVGTVRDILSRGSRKSFSNASSTENYDDDDDDDTPGIIILNPGQLLYSYRHGRSMTPVAWDALPRPSAVHPPPNIHPIHNMVPHNKTVDEHIAFVFSSVLSKADFVHPDAKLYLIGLGDGGDALSTFLAETWPKYESKIAALALTGPMPCNEGSVQEIFQKQDLRTWLAKKARGWDVSRHPLGTPLANPTPFEPEFQEIHGSDRTVLIIPKAQDDDEDQARNARPVVMCPLVSGGNAEHAESIMPVASGAILDWFEEVAREGEEYENVEMVVDEEVVEELKGMRVVDEW